MFHFNIIIIIIHVKGWNPDWNVENPDDDDDDDDDDDEICTSI